MDIDWDALATLVTTASLQALDDWRDEICPCGAAFASRTETPELPPTGPPMRYRARLCGSCNFAWWVGMARRLGYTADDITLGNYYNAVAPLYGLPLTEK